MYDMYIYRCAMPLQEDVVDMPEDDTSFLQTYTVVHRNRGKKAKALMYVYIYIYIYWRRR